MCVCVIEVFNVHSMFIFSTRINSICVQQSVYPSGDHDPPPAAVGVIIVFLDAHSFFVRNGEAKK